MTENLTIIVLLGISIGFIGSFLGIGGGSIIVPVLILLFPAAPLKAIIAISLGTIFFNSILNSITFYTKYGSAPWAFSKKFFLGTIPGAIIGSILLFYIPEKAVKILFAFFLIVQALKLIYKVVKDKLEEEVKEFSLALIGFLGGMISSLTGLGGGAVFVPLIKGSTNINAKYISVISNHIMILATFIGLIPLLSSSSETKLPFESYQVGMVNLGIILVLVLSGLLTRKIGVRFNDQITDKKKSIILASVFIILAVNILVKSLS